MGWYQRRVHGEKTATCRGGAHCSLWLQRRPSWQSASPRPRGPARPCSATTSSISRPRSSRASGSCSSSTRSTSLLSARRRLSSSTKSTLSSRSWAPRSSASVDSHHTHLAWTRTPREDGGVGKLDFPLLADLSKDISRKFNVLVENKHDEHYGVTMRGTYIIDPQGVLRTFSINDEPIGRSIDETFRQLEAAQFAAANKGKGCPANWKKGDDTIKADRAGSLEFFKSWGK